MKEENSIIDAYMGMAGGLNSKTMSEMFRQILDTAHETIDFNTNSLIYHKLQQLNKFVEEKINESKPGIDDVVWMQTIEGKMGKMTLESAQKLIKHNLVLAEADKDFKLQPVVAHNIVQISKSLGFKFQESKVPSDLDYSTLFHKFKYLTDYKRTPSQNSHIPIAEDPAIDNENIFG
jgi:hypothetical protein